MLDHVTLQIITAVVAIAAGLVVVKLAVSSAECKFTKRALLLLIGLVDLLLGVAWIYITIKMTNFVTSTMARVYLPILLVVLILLLGLYAFLKLKKAKASREAEKEQKKEA